MGLEPEKEKQRPKENENEGEKESGRGSEGAGMLERALLHKSSSRLEKCC